MRYMFLAMPMAALFLSSTALAQISDTGENILIQPSDELFVDGIYNGAAKVAVTPAALDIISSERLNTLSAVHPAEALNTIAGVNIHRGSGQEHLTAIRSPVLTGGAGAGSFLYLEDGVPLRAAGFANVNGLFEAGTEFARKLEVFKGPGPVTYGSNAVHGLINVQSRSAASPNTVRILASDDGLVSTMVSVLQGGIRASASVVHDNGFRDDSGFDQQKFQLKYTGELGAWSVDSLASFNNLNQETAGFLVGDDAFKNKALARTNANPEAFRDGKSYRVQARLERELDGNTLALTPFARRAELRFLRHFVPGQALEKNGHSSVGLQSAYYASDFNIGVDVEYTNGFLYEFQDNPTVFSFTQGLHYDYEVNAVVGAAYAEKDFNLSPRTTLQLGARAEYTSYDYSNNADTGISGRFIRVADRKDDFLTITPKVSLSHNLGGSDGSALLYARAARGSRAPQVTDLYSIQQNQVAGEADVETLDSFEIGYKGSVWQDAVLELSAFTMWKDNFFFRNANGFNVVNGKTRHIGIEASLTAPLTDWLSFAVDGTLAKHSFDFSLDEGSPANNITEGSRVDNAPDTLGTMRLTANPTDRVMGEIEWRHVGSYFTNPGNTARYEGHNIFVLRSSYALTETLKISTRIDNLFDRRYADRADFAFGNERFFPGRPRTVFIGLSADF